MLYATERPSLSPTSDRGAEAMPELADLAPIPVPELAVRLCHMYFYYKEHPHLDLVSEQESQV